MPLRTCVSSGRLSQGFSLHWSTEQTALMRTQIPSCCIDLQNRCIGEGKSMIPECPAFTVWPTGDLDERAGGLLTVGPCSRGRGLIIILYPLPLITSVSLLPDSDLLQGRSYTYFNKAGNIDIQLIIMWSILWYNFLAPSCDLLAFNTSNISINVTSFTSWFGNSFSSS